METSTRIGLVIDRSGSMDSVWDAAIESVNGFVKGQQQEDDGKTYVSLWLFDFVAGETQIDALCHQARLNRVPELTKENYVPRGSTPLLDAIGTAIAQMAELAGPDDRVLLVVQTDGFENCSKEWTFERVRAGIAERQAAGWTFVFLGCNVDAFQVASSIGIPQGNTLAYAPDAHGTQAAYGATSTGTTMYRATGAGGQSVSNFFGQPVDNPAVVNKEDAEKGVRPRPRPGVDRTWRGRKRQD